MKFFDASRYASPLRKALAKKENAPRNLRFETLENRALLSVTPLDELQAAVASAEIAPAQTVETPVVDLSVLAVSNATAESVVETEPNDAFDAAQDLGVLKQETTVSGVANAHLNQDFYKVEFTVDGASGHKITLTNAWVNPVSGKTINLNLYLYAADNLSAPVEQSAKFGANATTEEISLDGLAAGTYYVEVRQYGDVGSGYDHEYTSPYTLTIVPPAIPQDQYESNDTLQTAYDLGVLGETEISAKTGLNEEFDFFKFSTPATGTADNFVEINYEQLDNTIIALALFDSADADDDDPIRNITGAPTTKTISLEGLPAGDYYVRVYNYDRQANQAVDYALKINAPSVAPTAPTNFQTNANESADDATLLVKNETTLVWDNVYGETGYELRYTTDVDATDENAVWSEIQTVAADVATFDTGALAYGTAYKFQIRAVNQFGESAWTEVKFTTVDAPEPPKELAASILDPETLTVDLSWTDLDNELGYVVDLLDSDGVSLLESPVELEADTTSWTTPALALGTTYQFQVTAINNAGDATSEPFSFTTENVPTVQPVLTATVAPSTTAPTATLKWGAVETATRYVVEQLVVDGETATWTAVQTLENGETEWTTAVEANAAYSYRVVAANAYGSGVPSEAVAFTPDAVSTVVTTLADEVDPSDGEISLREAISYAETGATITFDETLKGGTITLAGTQLEITKGITVDASALYDAENDAPGLTLDANKESRVLYVANGTEETPVALIGLKITGGVSTKSSSTFGGGVYLEDVATFTDCAITDNVASALYVGDEVAGGGVYLSDGSATFVNCSISGNETKGSRDYGGGVYIAEGSAVFTNVSITGNTSTQGGGVYVSDFDNDGGSSIEINDSSATFMNCEISGNTARFGGGVYSSICTLAFENVSISGNTAGSGGGVYSHHGAATFTNVSINDNIATDVNGVSLGIGVYIDGGATFTNVEITGNTFVGDSYAYGGGVYVASDVNKNRYPTFTNVLIADNTAVQGGGVYVIGDATFNNVSIIGNAAVRNSYGNGGKGGGICCFGDITLNNSIVALNTASYGGPDIYDCDNEDGSPSNRDDYIIEAHNTLSGFTGWAPGSTNNYVYDATQPLFKDAADGDYRLADGSQALNKGDNAYVPETLTTDLAGNPRLSGRVDLGAYEFQGVATTAPTGLTATVNPSTAPTATLKWDAVVSDAIAETVAGYEVTLYQIEADGTVVAFEPQTVTDATYTTGTLDFGGTYYFEVAAVNAYGKSEVAKSDNFTVGTVVPQPVFYATLNASSAPTVKLNWTNVKGETGYRVEVQAKDETGDVVWTTLAELDADVDSYTTDVQMGKTYFYRVVALNEYGENASAHDRVVVGTVPTAPTELTAVVNASTAPTATLSWLAAQNATAYEVTLYQIVDADGETTVVAFEPQTVTDATYTTGTLDFGGTYYFEVAAVNAYGKSEVETSETFTVGTLPSTPTGLTATVDASFQATLFWTDAAKDEAGYRVELQTQNADGETVWTTVATLDADATTWTSDALTSGETYRYRVVAFNAYGAGGAAETSVTLEAASTVVTTLADVVNPTDGMVSLREAIQYAEAGDVVTFDNRFKGGTISLHGTCLQFDKAITIDGSFGTGSPYITVDGYGTSRVFNVVAGTVDAPVKFVGLTIANGYAAVVDNQGQYGGGIRVAGGAAIDVANSKIVGNRSTERGGGVYLGVGATGNFTNVEITGNAGAFYGGGVAVASNASATFRNSTVIGLSNLSSQVGIDVDANAGAVKFYNSIVQYVGTHQETQAIEAYNTASDFTGWTNADEEGVVNYVYDATQPLFKDATNGDYRLADGSQALNKGDNAYVPETLTTDLAGNPRVYDDTVDLGAYETGEAPSTVVTITTDVVDAYDGEISLREALAYAKSGETVSFAEDLRGQTIKLAGEELKIAKALTIQGLVDETGAPQITIDADGKSRVLYVAAGSASKPVSISGLKLTGGYATIGGGAHVAWNSTVNFADTQITANEATQHGGGLYVDGKGTFENVLVDNNKAAYAAGVMVGGSGEATFNNATISGNVASVHGGGARVDGKATFENTTIVDNSAATYGGGVYVFQGTANFTNAQIRQNSAATYGGGVYLVKGAANFNGANIAENTATYGAGVAATQTSEVAFADGTIADNKASKYGGGLYAVGKSTVNFAAAQVTGNEATQHGGGLYVDGEGTFENVLVDNNKAAYAAGVMVGGSGEATFNNATISGNVASVHGGGARVDGKATFQNTNVVDNSATTYGGGVYVVQGTANFTNGQISQNSATTYGGGVYLVKGAANFVGANIAENTATYGAGVAAAQTSEAVFDGATIADNKATKYGGGLYVAWNSTVNFADTQITANEATQHGGGLYVDGKGTFENVLVDNNKAAYAAGVMVGGSGEATFNNATISGNVASVHGGGARVDGKATFQNTLVVDNSATTYGGGVYVVQGTANFTNVTIADNTALTGAGVRVNSGAVANFQNAIILDAVLNASGTANAYNTLASFTGWSNAQTDSATQFVYNANQGLFVENGYALAENSQAIDKGNDKYAVDAEGNALTTDLAGKDRVVGTAVDLGAYEYQGAVSAAVADFDEFDFFGDEDELDALAKRLI